MKKMLKIILMLEIMLLVAGCQSIPPMSELSYTEIPSEPDFEARKPNIIKNKILVAPNYIKNTSKSWYKNFLHRINWAIVERSGSVAAPQSDVTHFLKSYKLKPDLDAAYPKYKGKIKADYIIIPTITKHWHDLELHNRKYHNGEVVSWEGCEWDGYVHGNIQLREFPSMKLLLSIDTKAKHNNTDWDAVTVKTYSGIVSEGDCNSRLPQHQKSINFAKEMASYDLLNFGDRTVEYFYRYIGSSFSVINAKSHKDTIYFETNFGKKNGATEDAVVAIYQKVLGKLTRIGKGKLLDKINITDDISYIEVDKKIAGKIKKGTVIRPIGKCGNWQCKLMNINDNWLNTSRNKKLLNKE